MESLQQIINGPLPVLVDFYADWCGPCKAMNPAISTLGKSVGGKARVLKINIDRNAALAQELGVQAVPTFIIFKTGKQSGVIQVLLTALHCRVICCSMYKQSIMIGKCFFVS